MIRRLFIVLIMGAVILAGLMMVGSVRDATTNAVRAGRDAVGAVGGVVGAVGDVVGTGTDAVGTTNDTVQAARELNDACDLVREAVAPGTPPEQSASLLKEAMAIVGGVVAAYPDVPGVADLAQGLKASRKALAADPTGQSLGLTRDSVDAACSQLPPIP